MVSGAAASTSGQVGGRRKSPTWPLPRAGKGVPKQPCPLWPYLREGQARHALVPQPPRWPAAFTAITAVTFGLPGQTAQTRWETGAGGGGGARTASGQCGRTGALAGGSGPRVRRAGLPAGQSKGYVTYTRLADIEGPTVCQVPAESWLYVPLSAAAGVQPCNSQLASGWGMLLRSLWGCGGILGWGTMPLGTRANQGLLPSIHRNHIGW